MMRVMGEEVVERSEDAVCEKRTKRSEFLYTYVGLVLGMASDPAGR